MIKVRGNYCTRGDSNKNRILLFLMVMRVVVPSSIYINVFHYSIHKYLLSENMKVVHLHRCRKTKHPSSIFLMIFNK